MARSRSVEESPEYATLRDCHVMLVELFRPDIISLGAKLFGEGLIPDDVYINIREIPTLKAAQEVVSCLTSLVKQFPPLFLKLVTLLNEQGPWAEPIATKLKETYDKNKLLCNPEQSEIQEDPQANDTAAPLIRVEKLDLVGGSPQKWKDFQQQPNMEIDLSDEDSREKNQERMASTVSRAKQLVKEANTLADTLQIDREFKAALALSTHLLSPRKSADVIMGNEVMVRALRRKKGTDSICSIEELENTILPSMRDIHERCKSGETIQEGPVGLTDSVRPVLLGVANFYLKCLRRNNVPYRYSAPIVSTNGSESGRLTMEFEQCSQDLDEDFGSHTATRTQAIAINITVVQAEGLPTGYQDNVHCEFQFWGNPPVQFHSGSEEGSQTFNCTKLFAVNVTEEFLSFIDNGVLAVKVWGQCQCQTRPPRRMSSVKEKAKTPSDKQQRSISDEVKRLRGEQTQRFELRIEIQESHDQIQYIPVEIGPKSDVRTGGVFKITQGNLRCISVSLCPVSGSDDSLLECSHISSISIGCIQPQSSEEKPLDSYDPSGLKKLCDAWSEDLMHCREYLAEKVGGGGNPKEKIAQGEWLMLVSLRDDVLKLKQETELPGASTNWKQEPGFESHHVPVLFLDDNNLTRNFTVGCHGNNDESMRELTITKQDGSRENICATASWDSGSHDGIVNMVTQDGYRVYAIVKVGVALAHPPGGMFYLRKRICMKVYKKGWGTVRRSTEEHPGCGLMYDVVMGIPEYKGSIRPPPDMPPNPSLIELEEGDDAVELFKDAVSNANSILDLDKTKQELYLKEKMRSEKELRRSSMTAENRETWLRSSSVSLAMPMQKGPQNRHSVHGVSLSSSVAY